MPPPPQVFVALAPRYPLFGGWSADFLFGWSMPLPVAVQRNADGTYALNALVGAAVGGVVVDQLEVRVRLQGRGRVRAPGTCHLQTACQGLIHGIRGWFWLSPRQDGRCLAACPAA